MAIDMQMLNAIHRLEAEIDRAQTDVKKLADARIALIEDLDEYRSLEDAKAALKEAGDVFRIVISNARELTRLNDELAEARFQLRDLREMLSHHLVVYTQDTGRDVVKDSDSRNRQIELSAKLGKPTLDQARLPLGLSRHFGAHVEISSSNPMQPVDVP